ncbi:MULTISPECIES: esterase-like activity of phytase family protein [unclassified Legionella]|uniref:esterase-like activity of phytase family protein n=1 Tax=unclassified Legionella TaxID=2622702 RepID=UPI0013EFBE69|nr:MULTISPECIES: esterase-like activity of phytase family protein [unclassified Legionella]MDI9819418.1 esterase-like activity of phytase family protein [Legionella sp. PL877]
MRELGLHGIKTIKFNQLSKVIFYCFLFFNLLNNTVVAASHKDSVEKYELTDAPEIGITHAGQKLMLGGFSGLRFLGENSRGALLFITHTDRGPNPEVIYEKDRIHRPFLLPAFNPRLVFLEVDRSRKSIRVIKQIGLKNFEGHNMTGLPQEENHEHPVDSYGNDLRLDPQGMDLEGIEVAPDGSFWMVEEYGPSIAHFSPEGQLLELFKPGSGLPEVLRQRQLNRGFEGLALQGDKLFAIMQSPLVSLKKNSKVVRLIEFDLQVKNTTGQYVYLLESNTDRVSDMVTLDAEHFLILEQGKDAKKVFLISLVNSTNIHSLPDKKISSHTMLENLEPSSLGEAGVVTVNKKGILDLASLGIKGKKIEGISIVNSNYIAVMTDNDFGLDGTLDMKSGRAGYTNKNSTLYLIPFKIDR